MSQDNTHEQQGIVVQASLPIRWYTAAADQCEDIQSYNQTTFQIIEALEEHHASVRESRGTHSQDYLHLDAKLDLLIDLVGQLLNQQSSPPVSQAVQLSIAGLQWQTSEAPSQDQQIMIELFLDTRHGRSIHLPAHVIAVRTVQGASSVQVMFEKLDEQTRTHLEKWIFRAHRRDVAGKRSR